jgi:hypothetical protein
MTGAAALMAVTLNSCSGDGRAIASPMPKPILKPTPGKLGKATQPAKINYRKGCIIVAKADASEKPEGELISAYGSASVREPVLSADLYALSLDGKQMQRLTDHLASEKLGGGIYDVSLSPEGQMVAFRANQDGEPIGEGKPPHLWILRLATGDLKQLDIQGTIADYQWRPDGKGLAARVQLGANESLELYDRQAKRVASYAIPPEARFWGFWPGTASSLYFAEGSSPVQFRPLGEERALPELDITGGPNWMAPVTVSGSSLACTAGQTMYMLKGRGFGQVSSELLGEDTTQLLGQSGRASIARRFRYYSRPDQPESGVQGVSVVDLGWRATERVLLRWAQPNLERPRYNVIGLPTDGEVLVSEDLGPTTGRLLRVSETSSTTLAEFDGRIVSADAFIPGGAIAPLAAAAARAARSVLSSATASRPMPLRRRVRRKAPRYNLPAPPSGYAPLSGELRLEPIGGGSAPVLPAPVAAAAQPAAPQPATPPSAANPAAPKAAPAAAVAGKPVSKFRGTRRWKGKRRYSTTRRRIGTAKSSYRRVSRWRPR